MILIEATDADFADLIAARAPRALRLPDGGIERPEVLTMLRALANTIRPEFTPASWVMIANEDVVGLCSIVKLPAGAAIDIGYGVAASRRNLGFASAAVSALLAWAHDDPRVLTVRADTAIDNVPSQRVLARNGFTRIGTRTDDEDGDMICWSITTQV